MWTLKTKHNLLVEIFSKLHITVSGLDIENVKNGLKQVNKQTRVFYEFRQKLEFQLINMVDV